MSTTEPGYTAPDTTLLGQEHIDRYEATGGEEGYVWNGATCLILHTTGRKSGEERKTALIYAADGDDCLVVASMGGAPKHPSWYLNLVEQPNITLQVKDKVYPAVARTATAEEKPRLWGIVTQQWPNYDVYVTRTTREIPVVILSPCGVTDRWEDRVVISGIGISDIGRRTGIAGITLTETASREAVADAGLTMPDIDGLTTAGETPIDEVRAALGIDPVWTGEGGSRVGGVFGAVLNACEAVAAGRARHCLVYRSVAMLGGASVPEAAGGPPGGSGPRRPPGGAPPELGGMDELIAFHSYSASNWIGMTMRRHMHLYGTTREQVGSFVINSRRNAALNPRAVFRDPMTMDDYLDVRSISDPLGLYDCDTPIDGAIGVVVSRADYAPDAPNHAVRIAAGARAAGPGGWTYRSDYPKMASVDAAADLWNRTDLTVADVDLAELYDGFSFLTLAWLEALGICGTGEAGPYVEGGTRIALDSALPLNTYGGQLSAGRMHGYWVLHEACTQLRGLGGERQVANHEVALVSTSGGPIATCMLLTR